MNPDCGVLAIRVTREADCPQAQVLRSPEIPGSSCCVLPLYSALGVQKGTTHFLRLVGCSQGATMLHAEIVAVHTSPSMAIAFHQDLVQPGDHSRAQIKAKILRQGKLDAAQHDRSDQRRPLGVFGTGCSWAAS